MGYLMWGLSVFVHAHAILLLIAALPYPTSQQWNSVMNSCVVQFLSSLIGVNVWAVYLAILCPCFIIHMDAIREYWKYSDMDYEDFDDLVMKETHVKLLLSQRNYYISGAAMILCILVPRLWSIREENGRLSDYKRNFMIRVAREFLNVIREVEEEENEANTRKKMTLTSDSDALLEFVERGLEKVNNNGKEKEDFRDADEYSQAEEFDFLTEFYERMKNQEGQNRSSNNNHNRRNNQGRQRLARSRFSSTIPQRAINDHSGPAPQRYLPRFRFGYMEEDS